MAERFKCCNKNWFNPMEWLNHVEVAHHFIEVLSCPYCAIGVQVRNIRVHITDEHLIRCPSDGCLFISESFDAVQQHVLNTHSVCGSAAVSSSPVEQEGSTSGRIATLLQSVAGVKSVRLAKHLVLHRICAEDRGYGCGYRNVQNIVASLLFESEFTDVFGFKATPNITQIQIDIERAWRVGFDSIGAAQLNRHLVGTTKWIGATEVATYLQYHHIRINLVDVRLHNNKAEGQRRMVDWIRRYFNAMDVPFPLYLQREGHSVTVIGVEETADSCNLLVYDPLVNPAKIQTALDNSSAKQLTSLLCQSPSSLNRREYQIVAVRGTLPDTCYENAKSFTDFNHIVL